jgi:ribokinase
VGRQPSLDNTVTVNSQQSKQSTVNSQQSTVKVLGIGALNVDYIFSVEELVIDGETAVLEFYKSPGGSAVNTITLLRQLGIPTVCFGVLGDDEDGEFFQNCLARKEVELKIKKVHGFTGRAFIFVDRLGRRSIYVMPGVNLRLEEIDYPSLERFDFNWVHATSLVGERAFKKQFEWLLSLPDEIKISFSPGNLYSKLGLKTLEPLLKKTYVLFLNRDELFMLAGKKSTVRSHKSTVKSQQSKVKFKEALERLHDTGVRLIAVTLGKKGALISDGRRVIKAPSMAEHVIDTTGAGDAFSAGVLYGLIKNLEPEECLRLGNYLAGKVVGVWGSQLSQVRIPSIFQ